MQFGYMTSKSAAISLETQQAAMQAAGFNIDDPHEHLFCDDRDIAIAALNTDDELVVASAACLGSVASDVLGVIKAVSERGGAIRVLDLDMVVVFSPEAQAALDVAMQADHANRKASIAIMRKARNESGKLGGKKPVEWGPKQVAQIKEMEAQGKTRDEIAKALHVSRSTLMRKLREINTKKGADQ